MLTFLEIASHPDDLMIICGRVKGGGFTTDFFRGKGHKYKPLLTCECTEALEDSREAALERIKNILEFASCVAFFYGFTSESCDEFIKQVRDAGYPDDRISGEKLKNIYNLLPKQNDIRGLVATIIDVRKVMNAIMVDEIMERLKNEDSCDTSQRPLASFVE